MSGWGDDGRAAGGRGSNTTAPRGFSSKGKPKQDRSWDKRQPAWQPKGAWRFQNFPPGKTCVFDGSNLSPVLAFPKHLIELLSQQAVTRVTLGVPIMGAAELDVRLLDSRIVESFLRPEKIDLFEMLQAIPKNVEAFLASARDFGMEKGEFYFDKAKMNAHLCERSSYVSWSLFFTAPPLQQDRDASLTAPRTWNRVRFAKTVLYSAMSLRSSASLYMVSPIR